MGKPLTSAGHISLRNGAYLIHVPDPGGDSTDDAEYDCSSSFAVAKRVARSMAQDWDFVGPFRWEVVVPGLLWRLLGVHPDDQADLDPDVVR